MPKKPTARPRPPERDYSHRSLLDKLGVKPGQRIAVFGLDAGDFLKELAGRTRDITRDEPKEDCNLIFFAAENCDVLTRLTKLKGILQPAGAIWVVYPKGQTHIRETDVFAAGEKAGLVDNKVCRFSETHTALRFVIPRSMR